MTTQMQYKSMAAVAACLVQWLLLVIPSLAWAGSQNALRDVPVEATSVLISSGSTVEPTSNVPLMQQQEPLDAAAVRRAIKLGIGYLKSAQLRDGSWSQFNDYQGGITALAVLALVNAGEPVNSPVIQRALKVIEAAPRVKTYVVALRVMALAAVDPKGKRFRSLAQADVDWLLKFQLENGAWTYMGEKDSFYSGDGSNAQFALLALHEATGMGIEVPDSAWKKAAVYWQKLQDRNGGFGYTLDPRDERPIRVRGSMTCAGIASTIIINEHLVDPAAIANGPFANCCQPNPQMAAVDRAVSWLANNYSVRVNPGIDRQSHFYYLYALERAGRFSGRRFIGPHDWYRDGVQELLDNQRGSGAWEGIGIIGERMKEVATSFALLFLSKGKRPVAIGKFDHNVADWDLHPRGVHYLTRALEKEWEQKLNWQTVRAEGASVDDLFEAPVLFMSGKDAVGLNQDQKAKLKKYIENGGFLFAEACQGDGCPDGNFTQAFIDLMQELFPDSQLEPLPANHPIWNAYHPLLPNAERPLSGLQACCRTSVVFCPRNLSCYWTLGREEVMDNNQVNPALRNRIRYAQQLGVNVITYATGRELKEKGETPTLVENRAELLRGRSLVFPKLNHNGGADDAPNAWRRVLNELRDVAGLEINTNKQMIDPTAEQLADYPFVFMHGRNRFRFSDQQREAIREYLKRGGFIFAESICASDAFTDSFRDEMRAILGQGALGPIPEDHEIWNDPRRRFGPVLDKVTLRIKGNGGEFKETLTAPQMEGVVYKGRLAVIFSPYDLSCALENTAVSNCNGYIRADALQIASNIIFYSLRRDANED